jgi:hypothetical protein
LHPKTPSAAKQNLRKILEFIHVKKKSFPTKYLNCEEELYNARGEFIIEFLKNVKKVYSQEKMFHDSLLE